MAFDARLSYERGIMSMELTLEQTTASGPLVPARFAQSLSQLAKVSSLTRAPAPRGAMHGQELWLSLSLALDDAACAAFMLDFAGQGKRVKGTAHGPSAALFQWAFHALAASTKCTLVDVERGEHVAPDPDAYRDAAIAYLTDYEAGVRTSRRAQDDEEDGMAFLVWLAREEHIALADDGGALGVSLPMDDAAALYEMLLESDVVEDVFVSERELASLLGRFRARRKTGP